MSYLHSCGFISLLYSIGDTPLELWSKHVSLDGRIQRVNDESLNGDKVIEIMGPHDISTPTNITCPANPMNVLNIKLPVLVLIVNNLELKLKLEFQLLDKEQYRRKFVLTTYSHEKQLTTNVSQAYISLQLQEGWNNLEINLQSLCHDVYGTDYQALQRIIIYPNCRLRRVYLQDKHYNHDETPVELCQAFFDMYMLKWGIHLVERSCQTEEFYTGPLKLHDLEYLTIENSTLNHSSASSSTSSIDSQTTQIKNIVKRNVKIATTSDQNKTITLKNSSKSVDELDKEINVLSNQKILTALRKEKPNSTSCSMELPINKCKQKNKLASNLYEKKKRETNCITEKNMKQEICIADVNTFLKSVKENKQLTSFPHVEKSQYLKMQIKENFLNQKSELLDHIFQKRPRKYSDLILEIEKNVGSEDNSNNKKSTMKKIFERHTSLNHFDPNFIMSSQKCIPTSKRKRILNTKIHNLCTNDNNAKDLESSQDNGFQLQNVKAIQNIVSEVQKVKEKLNCHHSYFKGSAVTIEKTLTDIPVAVPRFVEMQTESLETKSKKILLTTNEAVRNVLELRHIINRKILEKLQTKGLSMTEVELSIYNSKNRRNCYGQGKIIDCHKRCANKGNGLSSVKPLEVDASLKRKQLPLNDKICIELRNELDMALSQLKTTHVRITSEMVQNTIGTIIKKTSNISNVYFFSTQEAELIKKKVHYTENMLKRDRDADQYCEYLKAETNCSIIKNINQFNSTHDINVLFRVSCNHQNNNKTV